MDNHLSSPDLPDEVVHAEVFTSITIKHPQETDDHEKPLIRIPRVHPQFRKEQVRPNTYDPLVISLGPYHHGEPELRQGESYKPKSVDRFISLSSCKDRFFFYSKVLERIQEIRDCYEEEAIQEYDDQALTAMILHDACFIIYLMMRTVIVMPRKGGLHDHFGSVGVSLVFRDVHLLENQIPLWIIKFLVCLQSDQGQYMWGAMLAGYLALVVPGVDVDPERFPWAGEGKYEPVHLLDAIHCYKAIPMEALYNRSVSSSTPSYRNLSYKFCSTTNLRLKGIRFRLSDPNKETESTISFTSHSLYGRLHLPSLILTRDFFPLHSNLIAYEMSPYGTDTKLYVTCFLNFIKSLIESSNDAKILREDGILFSNIGSDDEVVQMIKDLNSLGIDNWDVFSELKTSINRHCSSKRKTWIADLIHNYFRSPWTVVAVIAAFCLFGLSFIQTFFTIYNPTH